MRRSLWLYYVYGALLTSVVGLGLFVKYLVDLLTGKAFSSRSPSPSSSSSSSASSRNAVTDARYLRYGKHLSFQVNGILLHCVRNNDKRGEPVEGKELVLLLHGFPENWYSFRYQLEAISSEGDYDAVALDLRGYGESSRPMGAGEYTCKTLVSDVLGLVEALGYESFHLIGHDVGGVLSWCVAKAAPKMVTSLTIINAPHPRLYYENFTIQQFLKSSYVFFFLFPFVPEMLLKQNSFEFIEKGLVENRSSGVINKASIDADDLYLMKSPLFEKENSLTCMLNYYRYFLFPCMFYRCPPKLPFSDSKESDCDDDGDWSSRLDVRTLVLWGTEDKFLDKRVCLHGVEDLVSQVEVKTIDDCSHWAQQDRHEAVNEEILAWLKG